MVGRVPIGAQLFLLAVAVLWAWLVTHVALLVRVLRVPDATARDRWWALVPVATPFIAWRHTHRRHVILWVVLVVLYAATRWALARQLG